jgi:hypothetical protein
VLAKLTAKNQLTLPKSITNEIFHQNGIANEPSEYFDVKVENGKIILTPVKIQQSDAVRSKLAALGINEQDVIDAVAWARAPRSQVQ